MLEGLTEQLCQDIETFKHVMDAHDHARALYDTAPTAPDPWAAIRGTSITKTDWHIYDHCAAFTRLYAIYATYVEDLIETYLVILPTLYATYDDLPKAITTQHRVGLGLILGKLGDGSAYSYLDEKTIVTTLSHGLGGGTPYKLVKHAFLADRQNYRLEVLGRLLGYLGIQNGAQHLSKNRAVLAFLETIKSGATTVQNELDQFVKRRNEAAHRDVNDIVATDEIKQTADFVRHVGNALAEILTYELVNRRYTLGHFPMLGTVEKTYQNGTVIISHVKPCMLRIGEQLAIVHGDSLRLVTIGGLQLNDVDYNPVLLTAETELGIKIDHKAIKSAAIYALRDQQTAPYQLLQAFYQRRDEIVDLLTDRFEDRGFRTDYGAEVEIDSIDNVELDKPNVTGIEEHTATLAVTAHITFTATATYQDPNTGIYDSEDKSAHSMETNTEAVQRIVRVPFKVLVEYENVMSLTEPAHAHVSIEDVNNGADVVIDLDISDELK